ncbi:MAG: response regulator [Deltaproteobacteria bacterium]|nr:response regulator [Deltaproteobacteria bacterium]
MLRPDQVLSVLIVDDNVGLAENIAEILDAEGYATEIAASAEEALPKARARVFSAVVTDFRLPGLTGVDLIRSLRKEGQYPAAVVISAYADDGTMSAAQDVGARFLGKPIDVGLLNVFLSGIARVAD